MKSAFAGVIGLLLLLAACEKQPEADPGAGTPATGRTPANNPPPSGDASGSSSEPIPEGVPKITQRPPKPERPPVAEPVAGKPGYVTSPRSGKEVFVAGLAAGTLMRDPDFPEDESARFTVPESPDEPGTPPVARSVPGRASFIFSPYNNKLIDIQGIPPGTLIADPTYPPSEKKYFRAPPDPLLIVKERRPVAPSE